MKILFAMGLAAILIAILIPSGGEEAETIANEGESSLGVTLAHRRGTDDHSEMELTFVDPGQVGLPKVTDRTLEERSLKSIIDLDPFAMPQQSANAGIEGEPARTKAESTRIVQPRPSTINAEKIQAVYRTDDGGMAVIDGEVVPVSDPERLIELMRTSRQ